LYDDFINLLFLLHVLALAHKTVLYNSWMEQGLAYRTTPSYQYIHVISAFPQKW
jgi:hypothetical protein